MDSEHLKNSNNLGKASLNDNAGITINITLEKEHLMFIRDKLIEKKTLLEKEFEKM